ncbi:hypothetical protein [Chengkuizengella axinellae]|uniref:Glycerophosphoryl diester phosphodiesterase membrane domain-containing protein n=1 Tax=Chengkuizengella axinellae TaxID=3064388 RepID=A0ABT9J3K8_9BACL|nr:hypothetical protein [Chengkuizengella sp. 2205SS18-9]MDP5275580.1 hypothetical protein [Chengkuizengella sp. 2205SS18-9]
MAFNRIFWGILFWFDFRINDFDILPDIVGYILIFSGLSLLLQQNSHFISAQKLSIPLIVLSIFDVITLNIGFLGYFIFVGFTILNLLLVFHLCKGIEVWARFNAQYQLADLAMNRWKIYFIVSVVGAALVTGALIILPLAFLLIIPLLIANIIAIILLLTLMKNAQKELRY